MATWSEENLQKIKNIMGFRQQASDNLASGGQLLQTGIGQLGQGIQHATDLIQSEKSRRSQEQQLNLNRLENARQFDKQSQFDTDKESGKFAKTRQQTLSGIGEWPKYIEELHGPDRGNDEKKNDFNNLEAFFNDTSAEWAIQGTIKNLKGNNLPESPDGIIKDWQNVDFAELENRLISVVNGRADWDQSMKRNAREYAKQWIKYRIVKAMEAAATENKDTGGFLSRIGEAVGKSADALSGTSQARKFAEKNPNFGQNSLLNKLFGRSKNKIPPEPITTPAPAPYPKQTPAPTPNKILPPYMK